MLLALGLRLWGLRYGLPYLRHPDEPRYIASAILLFKTGSLDPNTLPDLSISAFVYVINALAYLPYYLAGKVLGPFQVRADLPEPQMLALGIGRIAMPSLVLMGRSVTLLFGVATVWLVYLLGRRLTPDSPTVGWLAALLVTVSPTLVLHSRTVTPDAFLVFWSVLALWAAVEILQTGRMRAYLIGGLAVGFAVGSKLNGVVAGLPLVVAHFLATGRRGLPDRRFYVMGGCVIVATLIATPYLLGDAGKVWADILFERQHYATGHDGMEGATLRWYLTHMWRAAGPLYFLALVGIGRALLRRDRVVLVVALYTVVYFGLISVMVVRNDRTLLPVLPFACLLAAVGLAPIVDPLRAQRYGGFAVAALVLALVAYPVHKTVDSTRQLVRVDGFVQASTWLAEDLSGAHQDSGGKLWRVCRPGPA